MAHDFLHVIQAKKQGVIHMGRYIIIGIISGVLFGIMDGIFNANPLAQRLYKVFKPIARKSINMTVGILIDLIYGFALAGMFILFQGSLPFTYKLLNGFLYGVLIWFLRVVMQVASQWMMFNIPVKTMIYTLSFGLVEMLVLGLLYGLTL